MAAPQPPAHRRGFSFQSDKSHRSSGSKPKIDLRETAKEKEARKIHTHADPTLAISELQPSVDAMQSSNMQSLRALQHKDRFGNPITDPDLSNPTRHRLERPLDTIRAFEAAIDGTYNSRRLSYVRPDESPNRGYSSRPGSYMAPDRGHPNRSYSDINGTWNGRGNQSRPDSYIDSYSNHYNNYSGPPPRVPRHGQRNYSDYAYASSSQNYSPPHGTPNESNSTDPSSVNSSRDRLQQQQQQQQMHPYYQRQPEPQPQASGEAWGFNGFGADPQLDYTSPNTQMYHQPTPAQSTPINFTSAAGGGRPGVPPKDAQYAQTQTQNRNPLLQKNPSAAKNEKRKSWFKRFSRS